MKIIVVGPDGSGKTTLANKLAASMGIEVIHRSRPESEAERIDMFEMYKELCSLDGPLVLDRAWYCEMVYGRVMRDKAYISLKEMYELEDILKHKKAVIIHCTDYIERLWKRCQDRGEDYIKNRYTLENIRAMYEDLLHNVPHKIPVVRYRVP